MVPQQVSFVDVSSLSQRVPYRRFHCIQLSWIGKIRWRPTSEALVLVSSRVWTSSALSNMLPVEVASSLSSVSSNSFSRRLLSLTERENKLR